MQKWEYKVVEMAGIHSDQDREEYADGLTILGADGWELIQTTSGGSQYHTYLIFKRPGPKQADIGITQAASKRRRAGANGQFRLNPFRGV